jgi:hypothetical protein
MNSGWELAGEKEAGREDNDDEQILAWTPMNRLDP